MTFEELEAHWDTWLTSEENATHVRRAMFRQCHQLDNADFRDDDVCIVEGCIMLPFS